MNEKSFLQLEFLFSAENQQKMKTSIFFQIGKNIFTEKYFYVKPNKRKSIFHTEIIFRFVLRRTKRPLTLLLFLCFYFSLWGANCDFLVLPSIP